MLRGVLRWGLREIGGLTQRYQYITHHEVLRHLEMLVFQTRNLCQPWLPSRSLSLLSAPLCPLPQVEG